MSDFQHMVRQLVRTPWPELATTTPEAQETSKAQRMRNYLRRRGAASSKDLAIEADLKNTSMVGALLKADLKRGTITFQMGLYHWNYQYDEELEDRLYMAAALLRQHGYTVTRLTDTQERA